MAASPSSEPASGRRTLRIASRFGDYQVQEAADLAAALAESCPGAKTWILVDASIDRLHAAEIRRQCPEGRIQVIAASEEAKSFEHLGPLISAVLAGGFRRDCRLLAIGGGVVQDIAAFIAAITMRGVEWAFIPTTLLAQCDSCIGAKSSINIGPFKNQLGSFYPPRRILLVHALLLSLPGDAIRSGLGEIVKFHLVEGPSAWSEIQEVGVSPSPQRLEALIWRSLAIKRRYIEEDELDRGIRNLMNYGHTFGHAFESVTAFGIPHGIGVALGMACATFVSQAMGLVGPAHFLEVDRVLRPIYEPFQQRLAGLPIAGILQAMRSDKKHVAGTTYVILTRGPGAMEKVAVDLDAVVRPALTGFLDRILG